MTHEPEAPSESSAHENGRALLVLCALAIVAGVLVGLVGGTFRYLLIKAEELRTTVVLFSRELPGWGWLIPVLAVALAAALAALIVRYQPLAAGSGIQHVEAVNRGEVEAPPLALLPAKFVGGLLAMGSGMVLGREGPTVHMGAVLGAAVGRGARRSTTQVRSLQTSLAGAGLGVAFNAPLGGALFVVEEVTKKFTARIILTTLLGVAAAVAVSRLITGDHPDFAVSAVTTPPLALLPVFIVFGALTGLLGVAYNAGIVASLELMAAVTRVPLVLKAAVVGAIVGMALFIDPLMAGGGDALSQLIVGGRTFGIPLLVAYLVIRLLAGPLSYSTGVPGGLFAPLLAIGALWGSLFVWLVSFVPGVTPQLGITMALVGMCAFFGAVVRAPVTGIVLVIEMTAVTSATVPMLAATAAAVLVATLLKSPPIYDTLRERMLSANAIDPTKRAAAPR